MNYDYILTLCIVLAATKIFGLISGKMHLPQVVGALIAGLLMGPAMFNVVQPSEFMDKLGEIGVIVIMFSAGLDTNLRDLKSNGKSSFVVAVLGVIAPLIMGAILMIIFEPGSSVLQMVFIGTILTATSVSISVEALKDMGKLSTKVGNVILAAAIIDDILGLICLTLVTSLGGADVNIFVVLLKIVGFFVFAAVMAVSFRKLFDWYDKILPETHAHKYSASAFIFCLFLAWTAEEIFGVAGIIGAFFAGLTVATTSRRAHIETRIAPLSYMLLTPIFFANIGINIDLPEMTPSLVMFTIAFIVVAIISKLIGCGLGAKMCGFSTRQAVQVGFGMSSRGEVALIVANQGVALGAISAIYFGPIVILIVFCSVATPIFLKLAYRGEETTETLEENDIVDRHVLADQIEIVTQHLITIDAQQKNKNKKK